MFKRICAWAAVVLLAALLYFFENRAVTLIALLAAVLLPLLAMPAPLLCRARLSLSLSLPEGGQKGETVEGRLLLTNQGILPVRVMLNLHVKNCRTGEALTEPIALTLLPKRQKTASFQLHCPYCGSITVSAADAVASDALGLLRLKTTCRASASLRVLPRLFKPEILLTDSGSALPDSDVYAADKSGSDPSETYTIREYVAGDAIRQIHWKLSEKTDRLMVRELGLPIVQEVLLLFEIGTAANAADADAAAEVFLSLSNALLAEGCPHLLGWCGENGQFSLSAVTDSASFAAAQAALLCLPSRSEASVAEAFMTQSRLGSFAHIVVVGQQLPRGLQELYSGNRVTALLCGGAGDAGLQPDGTYLYPFSCRDYPAALCRLEV